MNRRSGLDDSRRGNLVQRINEHAELLLPEIRERVLRRFEISSHGSLESKLSEANDESLLAVDEYLRTMVELNSSADTTAQSQDHIIVFASHLHVHQAFVGSVETHLKNYGVEFFVAHRSIVPDAEWQKVILEKLDAAHVGVAFLHSGFNASEWCSQEVGWLLGRHVRIRSFYFSEPPKAFLGIRQAIAASAMTDLEVALSILDFLFSISEVRGLLIRTLVKAMNDSVSFAQTGLIWNRLRGLGELEEQDCMALMEALEENNQVYGAHCFREGRSYKVVVSSFLNAQPGRTAIENRLKYFLAHRLDR